MKRVVRNIQLVSNIATIIIAILLGFIVAKQYIFPNRELPNSVISKRINGSGSQFTPSGSAQIDAIGKAVPLGNIDWKSHKKNLVVYISTACHFCDESSPFYKQLVEKYSGDKNVRFIAVMPQPIDAAKTHLKDLGVNIENVYNASLGSIGITAIPTLLLVDESGIVSAMWRGKLTDDKEAEVLNKLSS